MATSSSQALVSLDFITYKAALKEFLRSKPLFKDLDYEASNINMLLDLLAYNTFQNAFYVNMVMSESFLDSAQLRSSIVSHAKDLNYLPTSVKSAKANITVTFKSKGTGPYLIEKGSPFSALVKAKSFVFTTPNNIVVSKQNGQYTFTTDIYEGQYLPDVFLYSSDSEIPRFKLSNRNIDTRSISVTVFEDGSQLGDTYQFADSLLGLTPSSKIFFLQATHDGYYEILFGDDIFGRKPKEQALINVQYRVSNGEDANGAALFSIDFDPTSAGELDGNPTVVVNGVAADGAPRQTNESIRVNAPRYFAAQQRAVSSDDYKSLILAKFPGLIDDVNVYGGETVQPKQYGRVIVALKPVSGTIAPDFLKSDIGNMLLNYIVVPGRAILADPEYYYLKVNTTVQFDKTKTVKTVSEIEGLIKTAIQDFGDTNLNAFDADFRYSRFCAAIDDSESSIVSNETSVSLLKKITPKIQYETTYTINFNNELDNASTSKDAVSSSQFSWIDIKAKVTHEGCFLKDDGAGNIVIYKYIGTNYTVVNPSAGTVDYTTGTVKLQDFLVADYDNHINIEVRTKMKDIFMNQNNILEVDLEDVIITLEDMIE